MYQLNKLSTLVIQNKLTRCYSFCLFLSVSYVLANITAQLFLCCLNIFFSSNCYTLDVIYPIILAHIFTLERQFGKHIDLSDIHIPQLY